jgi:hypothetical protein
MIDLEAAIGQIKITVDRARERRLAGKQAAARLAALTAPAAGENSGGNPPRAPWWQAGPIAADPEMVARLFAPDGVLPTQNRTVAGLSVGQRLCVALLEGALADVVALCATGISPSQRRHGELALAWFDGAPAKVSFQEVCDWLHLDSAYVVAGLRRLLRERAGALWARNPARLRDRWGHLLVPCRTAACPHLTEQAWRYCCARCRDGTGHTQYCLYRYRRQRQAEATCSGGARES